MDSQADKDIRKHFNSRARKVAKVGNQYLVPLKYDQDGKPLTKDSFNIREHLKKLTQYDWIFLECWRRHDWNDLKAKEELKLSEFNLVRLTRKLAPFREEEARDKALATIPTTSYIQARHVENVIDGGKLDDSQRDSLKELAKINGAYKSTNQINIQQNFFQKPQVAPDQAEDIRKFFDSMGDVQDAEVA